MSAPTSTGTPSTLAVVLIALAATETCGRLSKLDPASLDSRKRAAMEWTVPIGGHQLVFGVELTMHQVGV